MAYNHLDWCFTQDKLPRPEYYTLHAICNFANAKTNLAWPSVPTLMIKTRLTRNSVRKAIRNLLQKGFLIKTNCKHGVTKQINEYKVNSTNVLGQSKGVGQKMKGVKSITSFMPSSRKGSRKRSFGSSTIEIKGSNSSPKPSKPIHLSNSLSNKPLINPNIKQSPPKQEDCSKSSKGVKLEVGKGCARAPQKKELKNINIIRDAQPEEPSSKKISSSTSIISSSVFNKKEEKLILARLGDLNSEQKLEYPLEDYVKQFEFIAKQTLDKYTGGALHFINTFVKKIERKEYKMPYGYVDEEKERGIKMKKEQYNAAHEKEFWEWAKTAPEGSLCAEVAKRANEIKETHSTPSECIRGALKILGRRSQAQMAEESAKNEK